MRSLWDTKKLKRCCRTGIIFVLAGAAGWLVDALGAQAGIHCGCAAVVLVLYVYLLTAYS